jgi:hypothetical protein
MLKGEGYNPKSLKIRVGDERAFVAETGKGITPTDANVLNIG